MRRILFKLLLCSLSLLTVQVWGQSVQVTGTVIDEKGETVPGVTVKIKGMKEGGITNLDGKYILSVPSTGKQSLVFSFIGYQTKEVAIGKQTVINVILEESSQILEEVVVVGFGAQSKVNLTGAVKSVDTKVLASRPITSAVNGLQGAVAGLNITNDQGGAPGQKMNVNIRGIGSIGEGSSSKTLVLIDGMEGDLSSINPNDIASISILKDAAASSIYGSRAPNGVILVTTKTGDKGISVSYSGNIRVQQPISLPKPVDSYRYALFINDGRTNSNEGKFYSDGKLEKLLAFQNGTSAPGDEWGIIPTADGKGWISEEDSWANTNWYDVHLKNNAVSQEHNVNLSGGTEKYNFYVSARYLGQAGLFRYADDNFSNFSFSGNFNIKINKRISFNWSTRFIDENSDKPAALDGLFLHQLGRMYPFAPIKYPNGEFAPNSAINQLQNGGRTKSDNRFLYNQAKIAINPLKGWNINIDISNRMDTPKDTRQFKPLYRTMPDGTRSPDPVFQGGMQPVMRPHKSGDGSLEVVPVAGTSWYEIGSGRTNYYNANARTDYELKLSRHTFKLMVGAQLEYEHYEKSRMGTPDVVSDDSPYIPSNAETLLGTNNRGTWSTLGFFARLNYNYANRYMLEANIRADGASRFPSHKRWGYFPSFSAGWNVAEESFFEDLRSWFDMFKIRGSYGSLGNQNTDSYYPYFQKIGIEQPNYIIDGTAVNGLLTPEPFSSEITWEKYETANLGVDLAFLGRLTASFDLYQRTTKDMIGPPKALPVIFGTTPPKINNAALRTRGWELELAWRDKIGKDWTYEITGTLSDMKQIITRYDNATGQIKDYFEGKDLGDIWGFKVIGIAKSDEEMNNYMAQHDQSAIGTFWGGGDFMYQNLDDDPNINEGANTLENPGDRCKIGNNTPRFSYGIRGALTWKFLDFSMFWQGIGKRDFYVGSTTFYGLEYDWGRSVFEEHMDYFRYADNPLGGNLDAYYARPRTAGGNNTRPNDHYLQDASYLRLKNLTVGVSLPRSLKISKYVKNMRLFMSAENLFTITNLMIFDPEAVGSELDGWGPGKTYPMYRTISVGFSLTL